MSRFSQHADIPPVRLIETSASLSLNGERSRTVEFNGEKPEESQPLVKPAVVNLRWPSAISTHRAVPSPEESGD